VRVLAACFFVLVVTNSARAADLPSLDLAAICKSPAALAVDPSIVISAATTDSARASVPAVIKQLTDGCLRLQEGMKLQLEKEAPVLSERLIAYCTADAEFHGNGYFGIALCRARVGHEELAKRLEQIFLPSGGVGLVPSFRYCDVHFPPADRRSNQACQSRERDAWLEFEASVAPYGYRDDLDFERCAGTARENFASFEVLRECLSSASSNHNG
jgi:hypothetical protein